MIFTPCHQYNNDFIKILLNTVLIISFRSSIVFRIDYDSNLAIATAIILIFILES